MTFLKANLAYNNTCSFYNPDLFYYNYFSLSSDFYSMLQIFNTGKEFCFFFSGVVSALFRCKHSERKNQLSLETS